MKPSKEVQKELAEQEWNRWCEGEIGKKTLFWSKVQRCLNGNEKPEIYYAELDSETAHVVGPDVEGRISMAAFGKFEL